MEPERRRCLETAAQRNQQVTGDIPLGEARLHGLGAIHIDVQLRLVEGLLNPQVSDAVDRTQLLQQIFCELMISIYVAAHNLNNDLSRQSKTQDFADDSL